MVAIAPCRFQDLPIIPEGVASAAGKAVQDGSSGKKTNNGIYDFDNWSCVRGFYSVFRNWSIFAEITSTHETFL